MSGMLKTTPAENSSVPELKRALGTVSLTFYGLGGILGAGIYALIGKIAGVAGNACWLAFLASFLVAILTGLSYAALGARFPQSAGASLYVHKAFDRKFLSYFVGYFVCLSGVVSTGALSRAFAGYASVFLPELPGEAWIFLFVAVLSLITFWGIEESSTFNIFCTLVEAGGIVLVIAAGVRFLGHVNYFSFPTPAEIGTLPAIGILQAAVLAFYAFIGFEDIANVAEETRDAARAIPKAILFSLLIAAVLYVLVALVAVSAIPVAELAQSRTPLLDVVQKGAPWVPEKLFTAVALFAIANSALINFIMSSRLLYGMAREGLIAGWFGQIHPGRRTPHAAIGFVFLISLALSLTGGLAALAGATSFLLLVVFTLVHLSLLRVQRREEAGEAVLRLPMAVPLVGIITSILLMFFVEVRALVSVLILAALGLLIYTRLGLRR